MIAFFVSALFCSTVFGLSVIVDIDGAGPHSSLPATHNVTVGDENGLTFNPNQLNANIGDKVMFTFYSLNHTLTRSTLTAPCTPSGDFDSGFNQFNPGDRDGLTLTLTVNSLGPQWFFCHQNVPSSHCHAGMVFALNPGGQMSTFLRNAVSLNTITPVPSRTAVTVTRTIQVCDSSQSMASVYSTGPIIVVGTSGPIGNHTRSAGNFTATWGGSGPNHTSNRRSLSEPIFTGGQNKINPYHVSCVLSVVLAATAILFI